jgi:hypothetical protein
MTITLRVSDETLAALLADAQAQGRDAEELAAERLSSWYTFDPLYAPEGSEVEMKGIGEAVQAVQEGRTKPFDPNAILQRYGIAPGTHSK